MIEKMIIHVSDIFAKVPVGIYSGWHKVVPGKKR